MSRLSFSVRGARAEPFAVIPQLSLRILIEDASGADIYAIALRVQVMIEPQRRNYDAGEGRGLVDLFGPQERYGETLRSMLWTHAAQMVSAFRGSAEIELPVPCSYDFEVAAHKYLSALAGGDIPLNLLFSGMAIERGESGGITSSFVPWSLRGGFWLPGRRCGAKRWTRASRTRRGFAWIARLFEAFAATSRPSNPADLGRRA